MKPMIALALLKPLRTSTLAMLDELRDEALPKPKASSKRKPRR